MPANSEQVCNEVRQYIHGVAQELSPAIAAAQQRAGVTLDDMLSGRIAMDDENIKLLQAGYSLGMLGGKRMITNEVLAIFHRAAQQNQPA